MQLHPTSALYGLGHLPDYVVYHELVYTKSTFMSSVTAVDPQWLAEIGDVFYSIRGQGGPTKRSLTTGGGGRKEEIEDGFAQSVLQKERGEEEERRRERERKERSQSMAIVGTPRATPGRRGRRMGM